MTGYKPKNSSSCHIISMLLLHSLLSYYVLAVILYHIHSSQCLFIYRGGGGGVDASFLKRAVDCTLEQ